MLLEREWNKPLRVFNDPKGVFHNVGNGSIVRNGNEYLITNRIQNYHTSLGRHHPSQKLKVQTVSYVLLVRMDAEFRVISSHLIDQSLVYKKSFRPVERQLIIGLEDVRLVQSYDRRKNWTFVASTGHFDDWDQHQFWGQCIGTLTQDLTRINRVSGLKYEHRRIMEKNWLPFVHKRYGLVILYETNPMTILYPGWGGQCEVDYMGPKNDLPIMRGSGSPIRWGDNYLYTIHEQGILRGELPLEDQYFYFHRFVEMDQEFQITRISPLFNFREEGVEYTCGHCLSHDGQSLLVPYSSSGGTDSNLMSVSVDTVETMLDL